LGLGAVQIDELSELHLQALIDNEVPEGRGIDYKLTLPGTTNDAKKEFLADVSSFANAGGGDIVFGVDESAGLPTDLQGLSDNLDEAMLRIESSIRDGIAPRASPRNRYHLLMEPRRWCCVYRAVSQGRTWSSSEITGNSTRGALMASTRWTLMK
jgi:hypothetical protein